MNKFKAHFVGVNKVPLILVALPVVFLFIMLLIKSVNVPFYDEWELVPIIAHLKEGHFILGDFWHLHNEHRLFFPTLFLIGGSILTHWNLKLEIMYNLFVALISFTFVYKIFIAGEKPRLTKGAYLVAFLLSLIWFSPVQTENWTWGWQLEWFLNVLGIVLVCFAISKVRDSKWSNSNLFLMLTGGILAQFSLANGTLIWPIAVVILWYLGVRRKQVLTVLITGVLTTALYFHNYHPPNNPKISVLHHPYGYGKYVLIYLGRPLTYLHRLTPLLGFVIGAAFILLVCYLFLKGKDILAKSGPWVALGAYAFGSALITGYGRLGFGQGEAYASRYTTMSSLLLISTIVLAWRSRELLGRTFKTYILPLSAVIVLGLVLLNAGDGINAMNKQSTYLKDIKNCTHTAQPSYICLLSAYPNVQTVNARLDYLKQIKWGGY